MKTLRSDKITEAIQLLDLFELGKTIKADEVNRLLAHFDDVEALTDFMRHSKIKNGQAVDKLLGLESIPSVTKLKELLDLKIVQKADDLADILGHPKIGDNLEEITTLLNHPKTKNLNVLKQVLDHELVNPPVGNALLKIFDDSDEVKNIFNLKSLLGKDKFRPHLEADIPLDEAVRKGLNDIEEAKKAKVTKNSIDDLSSKAKALYDDPSKTWGMSKEKMHQLLVEENGFKVADYDGDSTAFMFVKEGNPYLQMRVNYGGGRHYPVERASMKFK